MGGAQLIAGAPPPGDAAPELQGYEPDDARHAAYQPYVRRYVETFARLRRAFADETFEQGDESA